MKHEFPSKTLEHAWFLSRQRGRPSCLFCVKLGTCRKSPSLGCGFKANRWWPKKEKLYQKNFNFNASN